METIGLLEHVRVSAPKYQTIEQLDMARVMLANETSNFKLAEYFSHEENRRVKVCGVIVPSDAYLAWCKRQTVTERKPETIINNGVQVQRLTPVVPEPEPETVVQSEVTHTVQVHGYHAISAAKSKDTEPSKLVPVTAPRGLSRADGESLQAFNDRIIAHRAMLAEQRRARYARKVGKVREYVKEQVATHGGTAEETQGNVATVALATAMNETHGVLSSRTSVKDREDIAHVLSGRFINPARPNTSKVDRACDPKAMLRAARRMEEYRLLQTSWFRDHAGHGNRMVASYANPQYRVSDLSASRVPFPHTEGFGRMGFEPSGTQGERMKTAFQRTPVRERVSMEPTPDGKGVLTGQYTSTYDERAWANSYDRLAPLQKDGTRISGTHPNPIPQSPVNGPIRNPYAIPTPQGFGAFAPVAVEVPESDAVPVTVPIPERIKRTHSAVLAPRAYRDLYTDGMGRYA